MKFDKIVNSFLKEEIGPEEPLTKTWKSEAFNKGLSDVVKGGSGTIDDPYKTAIFIDLHLVAGVLRDYAKDHNSEYYFVHNGQTYIANGENKLIKA